MTTTAQRLAAATATGSASDRPIGRLARSIRERISAWATTGADYFAAASTYEQLSRLSDAELHRRGLSRETLARDVIAAFDSASRGHMNDLKESDD